MPADISQLKPYFSPQVDDALLDRYQLVRTGQASDVASGEPGIIAEKAQVDTNFDTLMSVGLNSASLKGEGGGGGFGAGTIYSSATSLGGGTNRFAAGGTGGGFSGWSDVWGGRSAVSFGSGPSPTNLTLTPR